MTELSLVGSIFIDAKALSLVRPIVKPDDFENRHCAAAYSAACALEDIGGVVDPVTILAQAKEMGTELTKEWVLQVMELTPTAVHAAHYAQLVAEAAKTRRIKELATNIAESGAGADELMAQLLRGAEEIRGGSMANGLKSPADRIHSLFDQIVKTGSDQFISSGYNGLDKVLGGGFLRGGLYIIGARPAVGKTTFAINLAEKIHGDVLFISLEMSADSITAKQFARLTGVPTAQILTGAGGDELWERLAKASSALSQSGVYLNSRYDLTPGQIQGLAQSIPGLRAIIIDYLGLILPSTPCGSVYERTTAVSRDLKRLALQLDVPVICLSQLSRSVESRDNKRPKLSDLRDSGAIEQDADGVMFLYRGDYYEPDMTDGGPSFVELSIAKNRHGSLGRVDFAAYLHTGFFRESGVYNG